MLEKYVIAVAVFRMLLIMILFKFNFTSISHHIYFAIGYVVCFSKFFSVCVFFFSSYWLTNKVPIKRPSTGLLMYTLATRFCDEIHLYGFWPFPKDLNGKAVKYHYYDDLKYRYFSNASPHRMPLEFKTLNVLHNRGALKLTTGKCIKQ